MYLIKKRSFVPVLKCNEIPTHMAKNHLAIDINTSAVRFVKLNGDFVIQEKNIRFTDKQDYRYKQQLEEFWEQTGWKETDFDDVSLSWSEKQTSLVPVNVFNESDKESIFALSFGRHVQNDEIDYNRLPVQGVVNVFSIPMWVKSFFVVRFPRIVIQHEGTHLIRGVFSGQAFKLKTKLVVHETHFLMLIVQENNVQFYSSFEWNTPEDIVYYYSFSIQQQGKSQLTNEIELAVGAGAELDTEQLKRSLEAIHGTNVQVLTGNHLIEKYQQLCV